MPDASRLAARAPNLYEYLQVSPQADSGVIHAAYRALARRYHPDVNGGSDAARLMREINAAYHVLGDPHRRARYDAHRTRLTGRRATRRPTPVPATARIVEHSSRGRSPARVEPLIARQSQGRTVVVAFLLTLIVVAVLLLTVVAIANLDDRPPNAAGVVAAQPVLNRP